MSGQAKSPHRNTGSTRLSESNLCSTLSPQTGLTPTPDCPPADGGTIMSLTIPLPPVTKKNHSRIVFAGKYPKIVPSKQYKQYESDIAVFMIMARPKVPIDFPINLKCLFYQKTKAKSDLVGHLQAIQDLLVTYGILADDNHTIVVSTDRSLVLYDKNNPRTEITITKKDVSEI